ncbi:MAG: response regulator [bacterium]|nr:response regulator [bacterium]
MSTHKMLPAEGSEPGPPRFRNTLSRSLIRWFLFFALAPLLVVITISYLQAHNELADVARRDLADSGQSAAQFFDNWIDYRFMDLAVQAENSANAELLMRLQKDWQRSGQGLEEFVASDSWARIVDESRRDLMSMSETYDYIHDLFLIDSQGNILLTIASEDDLGTNLFDGPYRDTEFSNTVRVSLRTGESRLSDLERYAPSGELVTAFMAAPLLNESGERVGVFAMQFYLDRIMKSFSRGMGDRKSVHTYLVGRDGLLRSLLRSEHEEEVLHRRIDTQPVRTWIAQHEPRPGDPEVGDVASIYTGPLGNSVIGTFREVDAPGIHWCMIAEVDQGIAFASANSLWQITLGLLIATIVLVVSGALHRIRKITDPLRSLIEFNREVARGHLEGGVSIASADEIGELSQSFNEMVAARRLQQKEEKWRLEIAEIKLAVSAALCSAAPLDERLECAVARILELPELAAENKGGVFLLEEGETELRMCAHRGEFSDEFLCDKACVPLGRCLCGRSALSREVIISDDCFSDRRHENCCEAMTAHGHYIVPLVHRESGGSTTLGVLFLYTVPNPSPREDELALLDELSQMLSIAIQNERTKCAIERSRVAAEAASAAKGEFLANMSHEIRTPMNGVIGMTEVLLGTELSDQQRRYAETVQRSGDSLLALINDILDFSKIEEGKLELVSHDFDLSCLLEDFTQVMAFGAYQKDLELICAVAPDLPLRLRGDSGRLRQVLVNLVGNSIKFTEEGEVLVSASVVSESDEEARLRFSIRDTGIGIPVDKQHDLFDRFTQVDGSNTRRHGGSGLGLAISEQLVAMMGGEIGVESDLRQGTEFWFTVVFEKQPEQAPAPSTDLRRVRILVLADNASLREVLRSQFEAWGMRPEVAADTEAGFELLRDAVRIGDPYSLVLIDDRLSGRSEELLGEAAHADSGPSGSGASGSGTPDSGTPDTKWLQMVLPHRREDAGKEGEGEFSAHLTKPIRPSELHDILVSVVTGHRVERPVAKSPSAVESERMGTRILVADDNSVNRQVALALLKKIGLGADAVANGLEVIEALDAAEYDLILMDMQMPEMDGLEATRKIRSSNLECRDLPIIALTAAAMESDRDLCLEAGMNDFLTKPIKPGLLAELLEEWLPKRNETGDMPGE